MLKYEVYTILFQSLGQEDDVSTKIYELSEQFVCTLYTHKEDHDANDVRCRMYCAKGGKYEVTNSLHVNRHCKSLYKELINGVGYGQRL